MDEGQAKEQLSTVCDMLSSLKEINPKGYGGISEQVLQKKIAEMKRGGEPDEIIPC
jgi:hypothetical protein